MKKGRNMQQYSVTHTHLYNIKSVTSNANIQSVVQCHCLIRGPDVENPFYIYQWDCQSSADSAQWT